MWRYFVSVSPVRLEKFVFCLTGPNLTSGLATGHRARAHGRYRKAKGGVWRRWRRDRILLIGREGAT
jgi:hypothetical protein